LKSLTRDVQQTKILIQFKNHNYEKALALWINPEKNTSISGRDISRILIDFEQNLEKSHKTSSIFSPASIIKFPISQGWRTKLWPLFSKKFKKKILKFLVTKKMREFFWNLKNRYFENNFLISFLSKFILSALFNYSTY
jgi:hypothetical protein